MGGSLSALGSNSALWQQIEQLSSDVAEDIGHGGDLSQATIDEAAQLKIAINAALPGMDEMEATYLSEFEASITESLSNAPDALYALEQDLSLDLVFDQIFGDPELDEPGLIDPSVLEAILGQLQDNLSTAQADGAKTRIKNSNDLRKAMHKSAAEARKSSQADTDAAAKKKKEGDIAAWCAQIFGLIAAALSVVAAVIGTGLTGGALAGVVALAVMGLLMSIDGVINQGLAQAGVTTKGVDGKEQQLDVTLGGLVQRIVQQQVADGTIHFKDDEAKAKYIADATLGVNVMVGILLMAGGGVAAVGGFGKAATLVSTAVKSGAKNLASIVKEAPGNFATAVKEAPSNLAKVVKALPGTVKAAMKELAEEVTKCMKEGVKGVKMSAKEATQFKQAIMNIVDELCQEVGKLIDAVVKSVNTLDLIANLQKLEDGMTDLVQQALTKIKQIKDSFTNGTSTSTSGTVKQTAEEAVEVTEAECTTAQKVVTSISLFSDLSAGGADAIGGGFGIQVAKLQRDSEGDRLLGDLYMALADYETTKIDELQKIVKAVSTLMHSNFDRLSEQLHNNSQVQAQIAHVMG
jgi:hypothetical protein